MSVVGSSATIDEVAAGVYRIAIPVKGFQAGVNIHLVRGSGPTTLVDTGIGLPGLFEMLVEALAGLGMDVGEVDQVLLTHHHLDHIGMAGRIVAASGATAAAVAPVADVLADPAAHFHGELDWAVVHAARHGAPDELLDGTRASLPFTSAIPAAAIERILTPGDVVEAGDLRLSVLARPGHSATDTVFQDDDRRLAFVGDHLWFGSPVTPVLGSLTGPRPAAGYIASLGETRRLDGYRLLTGHGAHVEAVPELVDDRLDALERRLDRVRAVLPATPLSTWDLGLRVWRSARPGMRAQARLSALLAALELLAARGEARVVDDGDVLRWVAAE